MSLFLITGLPGSGKSTVNSELKARGCESYDGDEDHLAGWYNTTTRKEAQVSIEECTPEFLAHHSRDIPRQTVENLASKAREEPIFLCGDPENEDELRDLFSAVFALVVDDDILKRRIATRTNNEWGKLPHELEYSLRLQSKFHENCKKFGYIILNSAQPPDVLVDQILKKASAV